MVADQLREGGSEVQFSSYGEAASYVSLRGYKCVTVAAVEFAWSMEGGFSVKNSLANIPLWFANFSKQVNQETRNMTACNPDIVVSDSRLSPLVAARLLKIPSIVVLNQVKLLLSPRLRELAVSRLFENMVGEFLGSMWTMADRILVPDLPPPYTIAAHNIWEVGSAAQKLEYIGFASPKPHVSKEQVDKVADSLGLDRSRPVVFIHVSGPAQTRPALIRVALEAVKKLDPKIQFVISEGNPKGESEPRRIGESGWYYGWCPVRDEIFALSDLLVLRGGHVALSQAIQFGKPVVTVPIENHGEQLGNSAKVAELGMGVMLHPKGLKPEQLADAISQVLGNAQYRNKAAELQSLTENLNGIDNVAQIVRSYL
ncbi:putative glycosyltransferase [Candidatus Nitrososphaera gargensis Ga9.2]|uniref:Putative glycosyltransferase n=2 Tax=Candidatus Nitrososphaera gargensis TaxID=497727 RepID=K0IIC3_NITGG|nr:putative glycosyltransferase [Candidatus Nitrososphaera gargensis Ga9.2]